MAAAAALVVSVATAFAAGSAGAYPSPTGTVSGSCTPSTQGKAIGASADPINCTFTFSVASSDPVSFTTSAGTVGAHSTNVTGNTATATIGGIVCGSTPIPVNVEITSHPSSNPDLSGTATALVNCAGKSPTTVTFDGCDNAHASFPGYMVRRCYFLTTAVDGTAATYNSTGGSFTANGSQTTVGNNFSVDVIYPGSANFVTVTGTVASTATAESSTATGIVPTP